ncbi:MAG: glycogen debranching enzyme, partial [Gammaproteobacteria bacterium]|nr:glycogen debranching enzyme [Gammaproteobacteria bacterium]
SLHAAGIEVILDIVLNHTAEADHSGPTLSMRGLNNAAWYRLVSGSPRFYENYSGCGNSVNTANPQTLEFTLSCLRYWVEVMHVDGFRFDLAASLGRDQAGNFNPNCEFFQRVASDPLLSASKLIAEPWDVGPHGYQLGNFPQPWRECNGDYRDEVRAFWNHRSVNTGAFAERIAGSSDMYRASGRAPTASINFVTCHDGFTLRDLVSYERKHNEDNGEDNRDGNNYNLSANHGAEGHSDEHAIRALRMRQRQNFLATLILSQGVPHILAGDEFGHSQSGNNNAYCQDNPTTWLDWQSPDFDRELLEFTKHMLQIRRAHAGFRRAEFLTGAPPPGQAQISAIKDVTWLHPSGREMSSGDWHDPHLHCLGMLLIEHHPDGTTVGDHAHLVLFNASLEAIEFALPECSAGSAWKRSFDTAEQTPALPFTSQTYRLGARACAGFSEPLAPLS